MQPGFSPSKQQIPGIVVTALFALFVVMLPRYTDTAKTWFALLIFGAAIYLVCNWRQLRQTSQLERVFLRCCSLISPGSHSVTTPMVSPVAAAPSCGGGISICCS